MIERPKNWITKLDEYELAKFDEEWRIAMETPNRCVGYARVFAGNELIYEKEDYV